jgi:hypothetical protein
MSNPNYSLEVISHHPTFKSKNLRKYYVDGIETVGAWGDEPFEIKFTNHSWQKVQVKLSVDGTDILTGKPATTEPTNDMWVVNGYGTLSLKAWPETNNGGAAFVFTSANNSVAIHTHGDLSSRGIIAAAVYTEGHVPYYPPIVINNYPIRRRSIIDRYYYSDNTKGGGWCGTLGGTGDITFGSNTGSTSSSISPAAAGGSAGDFSVMDCSFNACTDSLSANLGETPADSRGLESLVAVGAGQHVDQKITYVQGLVKPTFAETVRVKYMWWDDLVSKLRSVNFPMPQPSGFPADDKKTNINLGSTPRIGDYKGKAFPREAPQPQPYQSYMRI